MPAEWNESTASFAAFLERVHRMSTDSVAQVAKVVRQIGAPAIFGVERQHLGQDRVYLYNSALLLTAEGKPVACYDKMHPVLFGEYMPFVHWIPWLQRLTPINLTLDSGEHPVAFPVGSVRFSPNICYESVLSQVIRGQVAELTRAGQEPQVLVNLTNDGWFWGSSELDMHLVCGVFRAVECRKPMVIAANTGFSAWIDGDGRILAQGPRRATGTLVVDVCADLRASPYLAYGDIPAGICLGFCAALAVVGVVSRWRGRKRSGMQGASERDRCLKPGS
jgi:apolipoprotein N-acyltransferase